MRILRKINKGLVLTVIVIVVLTMYLIRVETERNKEKPNIENAVKDYIELVDKYALVPKEIQKIYDGEGFEKEYNNPNSEFNKIKREHLERFKEELKKIMIDNESAVNMQTEAIESLIDGSNSFTDSVLTKYDRKITKIKKYAFDENQVTVTFDANIEVEKKYIEDGEEKTSKKTNKGEDESIILKREGDAWKVVYADLSAYSNDTGYHMVNMIGM